MRKTLTFTGFAFFLQIYFCATVSSIFPQDKTEKGKVFYQLHYRPGDWITYTNTRYINCLTTGHHQVFAGTSGGVVRYHYIRKKFDYPLTISNGLLDNDAGVVGYDSRTGYLWIATKLGLHYWDPYSEMMTSARYSEIGLPIDENILSIGFETGGNVWIHTGKSFYSTAGNLRNFMKSDPADQTIIWNGVLFLQKNKLPNLFTAGGQPHHYDAAGKAFVDNDFYRYPVTCFTFDAGGLLWTGTAGAGLWYAETLSNLMKPLTYGLFMSNVSAMISSAALYAERNCHSKRPDRMEPGYRGLYPSSVHLPERSIVR